MSGEAMILFHLVLVMIPIFSNSQSEEIIFATERYAEIVPQCNSTCKYVDWAYDANCRQRNLEAVPQECWQAKMLDLRDNRIEHLPANVFESFQNLLYLDLEDNGITDIDTSAFVGNDRVRHIYLQSNRLETIHTGTFTGVPNLLQLYLNSNRISRIEVGAFSRLSRLETLFLSENMLDEIPIGLLKGLERLRYFHMTHNRLTALHNDIFKGLDHLRHLNLINNNIQTIEAGSFKGLISLRVLRLAYNDISMIGYRAFLNMRHLIQLDLYSNKIQTISNFSTGIQNIEEVYLGDNPLKCDCRLEPLRLWHIKHFVTDSKANATCNDPESTKVRIIANMDVIVCPAPSESPPKEKVKQAPPLPAKQVQNSAVVSKKTYSHQQINYSAVQTSTIAVIVIACLVLFAVCFVGLVCFVYNVYIRKPFPYDYKHVSTDEKDKNVAKNPKVNLTPNPLEEEA